VPIEPNDLWLFAKIVDSGSFSKASEQVGLPKSTLSRRISRLENQLGERLLQRTTRKLSLTELGQRLLDHGRQIGEASEAANALAEHRQIQPSGVLRISMPNDLANLLLAPRLAEFIGLYPAISLQIDLSARRVDLLSEGFDLAIRMGELPDDTSLAAKLLFKHASGLYASPSYLAKRGIPTQPQELLQHEALHLLLASREMLPWQLHKGDERWLGLPPGRAAANSPELLVRLARRHQGIVAVPTAYTQRYIDSQELVRVLPEWRLPLTSAWAVFPGGRLMPAKTRAFIDYLVEAMADLQL